VSPMRDKNDFRRGLGAVDFTLLVIGAVIGADVYVVAAMGSSYLGPAQLVAWLIGGVLAAVIALAFVQCAAIAPGIGGSYAYARYLSYFFPHLTFVSSAFVKVALVAVVTAVNVRGMRAGGQINDVLTVAKLLPLAVLILSGLGFVIFRPGVAVQHVIPFAPLGWGGFGGAVLLHGIAVIALGAVMFEIRQNTWYRATLIAHEFALGERQFERWAEHRERWLLRSLSHLPRQIQESSTEESLNRTPRDRPKTRKLEVKR